MLTFFLCRLKCRERGGGDKAVWNPKLIPFLGIASSLCVSLVPCGFGTQSFSSGGAGTGGHMLGLLGSQECLDSPRYSHFLHFRRQNKGEKGSLAFFHTVYFYAVFQKLLQECSVGSWTTAALHCYC